ncbi:MAG: hypothetical protein GC204_07635 [Chloroflexi bacterium]|nr:hypothetical protein [Chloroflexota bacterium]
MRYEDLFVGILIIVLLIVAAIRILSPKPAPTRDLHYAGDGSLAAIGAYTGSHGKLSGVGSLTSAPLHLRAGSYRIDYQFDAPTRLALLDDASETTLYITSGIGTAGYTLTVGGRYRLLVEPADENAAWSLEYRWHGRDNVEE